ncbi:MAG TPA: metallopeptidase, M24 family protein [Cytophagales bacterium]|jgi:Xaa-Pro dipeptidase|nr:metallopeptidase, M24 family protein [Cytophagales bacterium]
MSSRRKFIQKSALGLGASTLLSSVAGYSFPTNEKKISNPLDELQPLTSDVVPISVDERKARIEKAQRLMAENKIDAIYLDGGTSMKYFTGIEWWNSERMMSAIIPAKGDVKYVVPHFEEERLRELITIGSEVRVWEEHESPYKVVTGIFADAGIKTGRIGMEEQVRFFLFDGIRKEASQLEYTSANPVTAACRMIKSKHEIELMQKASDITLESFKVAVSMLKEGMTQQELGGIISQAHSKLGARGGAMVSFGTYTAFPHGSKTPQKLKQGDVVLMDGGCSVEGYASDITRTLVFGEPTQRQRDIWNLEKASQAAGFAAAKLGDPCENVDIAARKVITDAGFGPGYKLPGLPHRTGHGIGMDGHEWGNMVLGNKQPLVPGMCFSIEPTISIYGEFGIRLEDCAYMTEQGVKWFTGQAHSLEKIFG